jgi:hypothetical protein
MRVSLQHTLPHQPTNILHLDKVKKITAAIETVKLMPHSEDSENDSLLGYSTV